MWFRQPPQARTGTHTTTYYVNITYDVRTLFRFFFISDFSSVVGRGDFCQLRAQRERIGSGNVFMNCFCVCPQNQPFKLRKMNFKNYFGLLSVHIISLND